MQTGYTHGPSSCNACFGSGGPSLSLGDWRLQRNPGYYGSENPEILVLGFSKGANQNKEAESGDFDRVAFAKARHRVQRVLEVFQLMPQDRSIDALFTREESRFGFASLVRCSFGKIVKGVCKTSGDVIPQSFTNPQTLQIINQCTSTYLGRLPASVKLVILFGTDDRYIRQTRQIFSRLYGDFQSVNELAFKAGGALWVYATHPSPGNGHFQSWVDAPEGSSAGRKREMSLQALQEHFHSAVTSSQQVGLVAA